MDMKPIAQIMIDECGGVAFEYGNCQLPSNGWEPLYSGEQLDKLTEDKNAVIYKQAEQVVELKAERDAMQAKIDALMLEYCPEEMTEKQIDNWETHQRSVNE